jgi:hypothetical protein
MVMACKDLLDHNPCRQSMRSATRSMAISAAVRAIRTLSKP